MRKSKKNNYKSYNKRRLRKMKVKDQGVTMVALVVTIIILLILSGITIRFVVGEDGIIGQAKEASLKYQNSALQEQMLLNSLTEEIKNASNNSGNGNNSDGGNSGDNNGDEDYQSQIDELNQTIDDLQRQVDALKEKLAETETERDTSESKVSELEAKNSELQTKLNEAEAKKKELQNSLNNANTKNSELQTKLDNAEAEKNKLQSQISDLNSQISSLKSTISSQESTISNQLSTISKLQSQISDYESQIADLKKKQATGTAVASDVIAGKTFSNSSGTGLTGTLVSRAAQTNAVSIGVNGSTLYFRIPQGAYVTNASTGYPEIMASVSDINNTTGYKYTQSQYDTNYTNGYNSGYSKGKTDGYNSGYSNGSAAGSSYSSDTIYYRLRVRTHFDNNDAGTMVLPIPKGYTKLTVISLSNTNLWYRTAEYYSFEGFTGTGNYTTGFTHLTSGYTASISGNYLAIKQCFTGDNDADYWGDITISLSKN